MSPHAMTSLVSDLVEMAKATEMLPQVQAECERLRQSHIIDGETIARLESKLIDRSAEIDELHSRIRSLEVERDDYGFRALAADDKANALASVLRNTQAAIGAALSAAEPEPVAPQAVYEAVSEGVPAMGSPWPTQGESAPLPTAPLMEAPSAPIAQWPEPAVTELIPTTIPEPAPGPYTGKLYMREPGYISRSDWLAGGGSMEAYDWRPGTPLPEGYEDYKQSA